MPRLLIRPPVAEPLSLAQVKAHLRLPHDGDDAVLQGLVTAARQLAERRTGLALMEQGWSVFADDWPDDGIVPLGPAPVMAIDDVLIRNIDAAPAMLDPAHYYLGGNSTPPALVLRADRVPPRPVMRRGGIEIRLTAGFGSDPADVPADITEALLMIIAAFYAGRGEERSADVPKAAEAILASHRQRRLA